MTQEGSLLNITGNSDVKLVFCIRVTTKYKVHYVGIGDIVPVSIKPGKKRCRINLFK